MKRLAALLACLFLLPGFGQQGDVGTGFGGLGLAQSNTYVGPGNVVPGAFAWWGLRSYTLGNAGNKVANVCNNGDANCADVGSTASGDFNVIGAQSSPLNCGGAGGTCTVKILYDQSGNTNCSGACDISNGTAAGRPTLVFNCLGSHPCLNFTTTQQLVSPNTAATQAQPITVSYVAERTGAFTNSGSIFSGAGGNFSVFFNNANNQVGLYSGVVAVASASDSAFHAVQNVFNGNASSINVDGTTSSGLAGGTNSLTSGAPLCLGDSGTCLTGSPPTERTAEAGIWITGLTGPQQALLCRNQYSYWGTGFAC